MSQLREAGCRAPLNALILRRAEASRLKVTPRTIRTQFFVFIPPKVYHSIQWQREYTLLRSLLPAVHSPASIPLRPRRPRRRLVPPLSLLRLRGARQSTASCCTRRATWAYAFKSAMYSHVFRVKEPWTGRRPDSPAHDLRNDGDLQCDSVPGEALRSARWEKAEGRPDSSLRQVCRGSGTSTGMSPEKRASVS